MNQGNEFTAPRSSLAFQNAYADIFINTLIRMYFWISSGLILTGCVAWFTYQAGLFQDVGLVGILVFFGIAIALIVGIHKSAQHGYTPLAVSLYFIFAAVEGALISRIFGIYTASDISLAFILTAALFGIMSVIGFTTKRDLSGIGSLLTIGLFGVVALSLFNLFADSSTIMWIVTLVAFPVFLGLTIWETKEIKKLAADAAYNTDYAASSRISIVGAVGLYLNIINLFLIILRLLSFDWLLD